MEKNNSVHTNEERKKIPVNPIPGYCSWFLQQNNDHGENDLLDLVIAGVNRGKRFVYQKLMGGVIWLLNICTQSTSDIMKNVIAQVLSIVILYLLATSPFGDALLKMTKEIAPLIETIS